MDVGHHIRSISDDAGSRIQLITKDGAVTGVLTSYCEQTCVFDLTLCFLDGELVGDMSIPVRDIVKNNENDEDEPLYVVLEQKVTRKVPAVFKGLTGAENMHFSGTKKKTEDKKQTDNQQPGTSADPERPDSSLEWDAYTKKFDKEVKEEIEKSKRKVKYRTIRIGEQHEEEKEDCDEDEEQPVLFEEETEPWNEEDGLPFDCDAFIVIDSPDDPKFGIITDLMRMNNCIGLAAFCSDLHVSRFKPADFFAMSMATENERMNSNGVTIPEIVIVVIVMKNEDGTVNETMSKAMAEILADPAVKKVVHNLAPFSDMMKGRFNVTWSVDEVKDTMCYDFELKADQYDYMRWKDNTRRRIRPTAMIRVEDLLHRHLELDFGADCFPHYNADDEYTCVTKCFFNNKNKNKSVTAESLAMRHELTTEAENFLMRKVLFLPHLLNVIKEEAWIKGYPMAGLTHVTKTRLELYRDSDDASVSEYHMEERYTVPMSAFYCNPHALRRRDEAAIAAIIAAAERADMDRGKETLVKGIDDLHIVPKDQDYGDDGRWYPVVTETDTTQSPIDKDGKRTSDGNSPSSSVSGAGEEAEAGNYHWFTEKERRDLQAAARPVPAPAGHAHLLNQARGPEFMKHCDKMGS
jgi:hypothetical protein